MNKYQFENLIRKNGGRCLWGVTPRGCKYRLELWALSNGETFIKQTYKDGGETYYAQTGIEWEDTAKALGLESSTKMEDFLKSINFEKLKNQKRLLLDAISALEQSRREDANELEGILNLIDTIQDIAVDEYGHDKHTVFNLTEEG